MSFVENLRAVLTNILANKFRVLLTALGIMAGSLSIVLVAAIARGGEATVLEQFGRLSIDGIVVSTNTANTRLNEDVLAEIQQSAAIRDATMLLAGRSVLSHYKTTLSNILVSGVYPNYYDLHSLELARGSFISSIDNENRHRVVVLGADLARSLLGDDMLPLEDTYISIDAQKYAVVGILELVGEPLMGVDIDNTAFLPYHTVARYTFGNRNLRPIIQAFARDVLDVHVGVAEIEYLLRVHYNRPATEFRVRNVGRGLEATQEIVNIGTVILLAAAAIVLIVAGIGIMNVLFVSVKERTREIGLLKALGARHRDILLMFLLESILISLVGGFMGLALSFPVVPLIRLLNSYLDPALSIQGALIGLFFSILTGTVFGYYPAARAAELRPIEALNQE